MARDRIRLLKKEATGKGRRCAEGGDSSSGECGDPQGGAYDAKAKDQKGFANEGDEFGSARKVDTSSVPIAAARESSGVVFYPPSRRYWRIGGKWYDFEEFLDKHPGGSSALTLARDRFEDCTFVFESHHHNYQRARAVIKKYEVSADTAAKAGLARRPTPTELGEAALHGRLPGGALESDRLTLLPDEAFYSVMRRRVTQHLKSVGQPDGGPNLQCLLVWWGTVAMWMSAWALVLYTGRLASAVFLGFAASWLGAFGHNWVHQPRYKRWAYLSLDGVGFSSDGWFREHNLQHHMYTNTPWDNHFKGTDPFLVTDPTVERNFLQRYVLPYLNPLILCFGLYANYTAHLIELIKGNEVFSLGKLCLPLELGFLMARWGCLHGFLLQFTANAVLGMYYFTMALMNHNAGHCMNVEARNASVDWGEAQLNSSADWAVASPFLSAGRYLWLNYHTVHHLFPRVDFCHHPAIQGILMQTCEEFGITYRCGEALPIYKEMVHSFSTPQSLLQEVIVYAGGL